MSFEMKAFLFIFAFGFSLKVAQSKINADLNLDPLFAASVDAKKGSNKPCCHPETLEGSGKALISAPGFEQNTSTIKFSLDYRNRKYAIQDQLSPMKFILLCDLYNTCLLYAIIESQKNCSKTKQSNVSFDDYWIRCIPSNATSQGAVRIGSDEKQSSLLLQNWKFEQYGIGLWRQRLVTDVDCIPVVDFMSGSPNSSIIGQIYYFDITKRIKDQSVFTPPPYCDQANDLHEDSKYQHQMFSSLFSTR